MRLAQRLRPGLTLFGVAVLLGSMAAVQADITEPMVTPFAVAAVFAIVIGEQVPMQFSQRVIAPLTTAPALGLILAPLGAASGEVPSAWTVLAVIWLSILVGGLVARALIADPELPVAKHTHARLTLSDGQELRFVDQRTFGGWTVAHDAGRRYAALSGDCNPIHLWPWSARLMGMRAPIIPTRRAG